MTTGSGSFRSVGILALCGALAASGAMAQSLPDTMVAAYLNSPEMASARADLKVFSERAVQERARGGFQLDGELSFQQIMRSNDRQGVLYPGSVALNASLPLYTGGQVENATAAAETRITLREALLIGTEQEVLLDAVRAHMDVRRDEEFVTLGENNVRVLSEQLRAANERFEVGEVTRTDVEQARAFLATSTSQLAAAKGALEASREAYRLVVGEYPAKLLPPPPIPELPQDRDEAIAMAMRDDPDLIAARLDRDASGSDVRSAMGALLPQVSLQATVSRSDTYRDSLPQNDLAAVGLVVDIPLYTSGFDDSNVREAQAVVEGASASITRAMRTAVRNVGVAWAQLEVARASIRTGKLGVSAAQLAFEGVQEEAKVGARTTLDVLNAEQAVLNARGSLVAARHDEYVAAYSVLAAVGKLTVEHLGLDTGLTTGQPSYYETVKDRNFGYDQTDDTVWSTRWRP